MFRTFFAYAVVLAYMVVVGGPVLFAAVITRRTDALYRVGVLGARLVLWLGGVRVEARGLEKIPTNRAVVFMPNHQSNCDPAAVVSVVPPVLIMVKKEFFKIPILGQGVRLRGFIPVDRRNREQAISSIERAAASLKAGHSFLAYPEGTRSPDGRLQSFKKGVFVMALEAGAPIVPVSVSGGFRILRKGDFHLHPGTLRITIHNPIPTEGLTLADRDRLMAEVRAAILSGLGEDEKPLNILPVPPSTPAAQTS